MTLALVDNLPAGPATLAIGLAPIRVTGEPERDASCSAGTPLLVRSPRLEQSRPRYFGTQAPTTGAIPGIFDYVGSYLRERAGRPGAVGHAASPTRRTTTRGAPRGTCRSASAATCSTCSPRT